MSDLNDAIYRLWIAALTSQDLGRAEMDLRDVAGRELAIAHLQGRAALEAWLDRVGTGEQYARWPTFRAALDAITRRWPRLASAAASVGDIIRAGGVSFARAATEQAIERARDLIAESVRRGQSVPDAVRDLSEDQSWVRAYTETAYRTTAARSYTDGMREQARDTGLVAGWRYSATLDSNVRPNHAACHGLEASIDDPIWELLTPPLGFNCRCTLIPITRLEAERRHPGGRIPPASIPPGGGPDEGFTP
jgi:SPP1 gp7 family putative phage head morphogenesis protein